MVWLLRSESPLLLSLVNSIVYFIYEGVLVSTRGQTVGKIALKIRVVSDDGTAVRGLSGWMRSALKVLPGYLPYVGLVSIINFLWGLVTEEKTCLHDLAARTRVVDTRID